jgi:UDP-2,4-diacetamido-2,4,6-trideoxy-beta-L-altropyranose hydrolase
MSPLHVAFRLDVNRQIGTGHLMRCLTLADELKRRRGMTRFVSRGIPKHFCEMLASHGHEVSELGGDPDAVPDGTLVGVPIPPCSQHEDACDTIAALADRKWDWLIVDHYALDVVWENSLRGSAKKILAIDDLADRTHDCDVLLDQNFYWDPAARYAGKVPEACQMLLGPRFALLREEFLQRRPLVRPRTANLAKILIFFGGVDSGNLTSLSMDAVAGAAERGIRIDVVVGILHPFREEIEEACQARGFRCHVQTGNISELMAEADLSIGAGGTAVWERCCMGLPTLSICTAPNQERQIADASSAGLLYTAVSDADLSVYLPRHLAALCENPGARQDISRRAMEMVDGRGSLRVAQALGFHNISIREACTEDSERLYSWRNHPSIRSTSRNQRPIPRQEHDKWLREVLADTSRTLLIGERLGEPVGVVRFDRDWSEAEVSIYLVPGCTEAGLGGDLLLAAEQWMESDAPGMKKFRAQVLGQNTRSEKMFIGQEYNIASTWFEKCVKE